ncbi:MAG: hypothetical protein LBT89_08025 [Planctomycetaceae bacterium]|jgi:hypothetical protein|nr:hypothetical protein [Planctomycetaceae bacterium]
MKNEDTGYPFSLIIHSAFFIVNFHEGSGNDDIEVLTAFITQYHPRIIPRRLS